MMDRLIYKVTLQYLVLDPFNTLMPHYVMKNREGCGRMIATRNTWIRVISLWYRYRRNI